MALWLKQSTAVTVKLGPFVDDTDGKTAETGLTISQADIRLSKNGGAFAQTNNAAGATHDENGYYGIPLDTTDTGTLGTLRVAVAEAGALPVWQDFMIVPANVWDSLFGADLLQVDVTQLGGGAQSATDLKDLADTGYDPATHKLEEVKVLTGHTAQTGDAFARLGAPAGASVSADVAAVKGDTAAILADTGTDGVLLNLAQTNNTNNDDEQVGGQIRRAHALAGGTIAQKDHSAANPTWVHKDEAGTGNLVTRTRTVAGSVETVTPA